MNSFIFNSKIHANFKFLQESVNFFTIKRRHAITSLHNKHQKIHRYLKMKFEKVIVELSFNGCKCTSIVILVYFVSLPQLKLKEKFFFFLIYENFEIQ